MGNEFRMKINKQNFKGSNNVRLKSVNSFIYLIIGKEAVKEDIFSEETETYTMITKNKVGTQ